MRLVKKEDAVPPAAATMLSGRKVAAILLPTLARQVVRLSQRPVTPGTRAKSIYHTVNSNKTENNFCR